MAMELRPSFQRRHSLFRSGHGQCAGLRIRFLKIRELLVRPEQSNERSGHNVIGRAPLRKLSISPQILQHFGSRSTVMVSSGCLSSTSINGMSLSFPVESFSKRLVFAEVGDGETQRVVSNQRVGNLRVDAEHKLRRPVLALDFRTNRRGKHLGELYPGAVWWGLQVFDDDVVDDDIGIIGGTTQKPGQPLRTPVLCVDGGKQRAVQK